MREFAYHEATDVDGAVATLTADADAAFIAGGTNLVDLMKLGVATPGALVDVARLPLRDVTELPDGTLRIGAMVRNSDLAAHPEIRRRYPVLGQALLAGASGQLRNMATTGGNLLQRTRCRYFQDVSQACNKRAPGTGCPAREGDHRNLAILGASDGPAGGCVATHPSDMAVALAALGATVRVSGVAGERELPADALHRLPGDRPERDTVLERGDLITAVDLPPLPAARHSAYRKARDRASYAFATGAVAAVLTVEDGTVEEVRLAWGAVAHRPWRAHLAEEALRGGPATREAFLAAADAELAAAEPLRDNGYKIQLIRNMTAAVLGALAEGRDR